MAVYLQINNNQTDNRLVITKIGSRNQRRNILSVLSKKTVNLESFAQ